MFNLKKANQSYNPQDLLRIELSFFGINQEKDNTYSITVGDTETTTKSLQECEKIIIKSVEELKNHIKSTWNDISHLSKLITQNQSDNYGSMQNIMFLNAVKNAYLLSTVFSDLKSTSTLLKDVMNKDIIRISEDHINRFNSSYLKVKLLHHLIMEELYRIKLLKTYSKIHKTADITGPWSNVDLPMEERVWSYDEDESWFADKTKAKRQQARYNPENMGKTGFYYVWQDLSRDPYKFEDMSEDSPYKSRSLLTIP